MAVGTAGVTRVTTDWQGGTRYSTDSTTSPDAGGHYMSDGGVGYIPEVWAL